MMSLQSKYIGIIHNIYDKFKNNTYLVYSFIIYSRMESRV